MVRVPGTWHFYAAQPDAPLPEPAKYTKADEHMLQEPAEVEKASQENSEKAAAAAAAASEASTSPEGGKEGA